MKLSKRQARKLAAEMLEYQDEADAKRQAEGVEGPASQREANFFNRGWDSGWQNGYERAIRQLYGAEAAYQVADAYEALERERGTWPCYRLQTGNDDTPSRGQGSYTLSAAKADAVAWSLRGPGHWAEVLDEAGTVVVHYATPSEAVAS